MTEKFLFQPVKPFYVSQYFGEDRVCISKSDNKTTTNKDSNAPCPSGFQSLYRLTKGHNGVDIPTSCWQPVYAAHDGIVTEVQTEIERGLGIGIVSNEKRYFKETNTKEFYKTRYWHFIALDVYFGEKIKTGDFIGYADSTGYSTGNHLHFELKPITIIDYENGVPVYNNTLQDNGMLGAIDPLPYMETISALQVAGVIRRLSELTAMILDFISDIVRK